MRLGDRNCKDDLDPLKKLLVIAAGAQRRSLHYWGAHNITEGFFFFSAPLQQQQQQRAVAALFLQPQAFFGLQLMDNGESHKGFFSFLTALINHLN